MAVMDQTHATGSSKSRIGMAYLGGSPPPPARKAARPHSSDSSTSTIHPLPIEWAPEPSFAMRPTQIQRSGGAKIPYPKHVWSPAGGWYSQPANWKANTAVMATVMFGIVAMAWSISADREHREHMPTPNQFFPSRYWSREIREHERKQKAEGSGS